MCRFELVTSCAAVAFLVAAAACDRRTTDRAEQPPAATAATVPAATEIPVGKELCHSPGLSIRRVAAIAQSHNGLGDPRVIIQNEQRFEARNKEPMSVLVWIYGVYPSRIDLKAPLPDGTFDIVFPSDSRRPNKGLQDAVARAFDEAFHLRLYQEDREADVWVLARGPGDLRGLRPAAPMESSGKYTDARGWVFEATDMERLCDWIEHELEGKPVMNETRLDGSFDFTLPKKVEFDSRAIPPALGELGLELRAARRHIDELVVAPVTP